VEREPVHSGLLQLFLSICIQKVTKNLQAFPAQKTVQIFVTIINGKRTGHKQLIAISGLSLPVRSVYAIKHRRKSTKNNRCIFCFSLWYTPPP
jgi:hypothetical protein